MLLSIGDMDKERSFRNTPHRPSRVSLMQGHTALRRLGQGAQAAVDWVLPPRCALCSEMITGGQGLCPSCFQGMQFLSDPLCDCCGRPSLIKESGPICAPCLSAPPAYDWMRAAFAYDDASRALILALKYKDRLDVVPALARWMAGVAQAKVTAEDVILPVPLHWRRYLARRFNQSAALAQALAQRTDGAYAPDWLIRTRNTPPMKAMTRKQRSANVHGAFEVQDRHRAALTGRRVVLVDDVYTSGATIEALSDELRACGVAHIGVVVVARVVHHTHFQQDFELE